MPSLYLTAKKETTSSASQQALLPGLLAYIDRLKALAVGIHASFIGINTCQLKAYSGMSSHMKMFRIKKTLDC